MRYKKLLALVMLVAMALTTVVYAQRFGGGGQGGGRGGGRGGRRGGFGGYYAAPRRPNKDSFTGDFTFCRLAYQQDYNGDGGGWGVDYPRADQNLSIRLSELSKTPVNFDSSHEPNYFVIQATDPELFSCPFVMMSEYGGTYFSEAEAKALRDYMLKGGFLWVDDSWGEYAFAHWTEQVRKIFPERDQYPIIEVPLAHSMFHTLFDSKVFPQIPSIGRWGGPGSSTTERADAPEPHARAILDAKGRVMLFMSFDTDFGDAYKHEGDDPRYLYTFSVNGYAIGIDVVLYAMTH